MITASIKTPARILWIVRPVCGEPGCSEHPQCLCSLCGKPIGTPEDDPRWIDHDQECPDCDLCRDQMPLMLWRGKGRSTQMARFHEECFNQIVELK